MRATMAALTLLLVAGACSFDTHSLPLPPGAAGGEDASPTPPGDDDAAPGPPAADAPPTLGGDASGALAGQGEPCTTDADCEGNLCRRMHGQFVCTVACERDADCPVGWRCRENEGYCER